MGNTSIEWTDATWNPIRGCTRVSAGCQHCYAEGIARRFSGPGLAYEGLVRIDSAGKPREWNGAIKFAEKHLLDPLRWKESRRIFVNSMSDLFHENVTDEMRDQIFAVIALCPQHTFQILTKRPGRMLEYFNRPDREHYSKVITNPCAWFVWKEVSRIQACAKKPIPSTAFAWTEFSEVDTVKGWPLPNVHLGVSVENRETKSRIDMLRQVPAALRFLSIEPLLENLGAIDLSGIGWVIIGGESGPGARPFNVDWIHGIVDGCEEIGVPVFVKQLGAHVIQNGERRTKRDKKGGDMLEWPHDIRVREFPKCVSQIQSKEDRS